MLCINYYLQTAKKLLFNNAFVYIKVNTKSINKYFTF